MIVALGVLAVTSLLLVAAYTAVGGDIHQTQHDLSAKRAYYAAQAGMSAYLYKLNQDPTHFWVTCSNDSQSWTSVPGTTTGQQYSYKPILANGSQSCTSDPVTSLIDSGSGTLTMQFEGQAGTPAVYRGIVVSFRMESPLDYLWYTKYEALDSSINGFTDCARWYRPTSPARDTNCNIQWASKDYVNGPMYTQDQYLVPAGQTPTFGSAGGSDPIMSAAPGNSVTSPQNVCANNSCNGAKINGKLEPGQDLLDIPADNSELATDAGKYGINVYGTTTITLNGSTATVVTCTTTSSCTYPAGTVNGVVNLATDPIIYVNNASCYTATSYSPFGATYAQISGGTYNADYYGCAGDAYIQGYYSSSLTIASADDEIIDGNITTDPGGTSRPTGGAVLGLVPNRFVRVQHGLLNRPTPYQKSSCKNSSGVTASNITSQSHSDVVIDAAIFNIQDSLIVDNFDCGAALGNLWVNGSIVQKFRGAVGTSGSPGTGYLKQYWYDKRLADLLPPYLFDISGAPWHAQRETVCVPSGTVSATACK